MRFIIVALSLLFSQSAHGYARSCKRNTEPCTRTRCSRSSPFRFYPLSTQYGCCKGNVFDQKNYVCTRVHGVTRVISCNPCNQFRCANGQCALRNWKCSGFKDCHDGTDEVGCAPCSASEFRCANGRCISKNRICNKYNDCGDGSDEIYCLRKVGGHCGNRRYRCRNDRCIWGTSVCNYHDDCGDGSDEENCFRSGKKRSEVPEPYKKEDDEGGVGKDADADSFP